LQVFIFDINNERDEELLDCLPNENHFMASWSINK
jgi:hypothetical protein